MKKRIIIFSAFLTPFRSGAEACAEEIALRLYREFDVILVTARLRKDLPRDDLLGNHVRVIRVGMGHRIDKWLFPFLAPLAARRLRPQVIHAVLETFAGAALLLCRYLVPEARRILTLQTVNRNFLRGPITRSADIVTAISAALVQESARRGRRDVTLIPNGIPFGGIRSACEQPSKVSGRVLFVGRLEQMKGVDILLQAFAIACAQTGLRLELHIVGEGSLRTCLERLAQELDIGDRVAFLGYMTSYGLFREYAQAEIFCAPSRSEALGNVFLEAQAAECAVIGTKTGGIPEIVRDGKTGLLVAPENPAETAVALQKLLQNPRLRLELGAAGMRQSAEYDWEGIARRYGQLYATCARAR